MVRCVIIEGVKRRSHSPRTPTAKLAAAGFTRRDYENLEVALRLRIESCEDNADIPAEVREGNSWKRTHAKVLAMMRVKR